MTKLIILCNTRNVVNFIILSNVRINYFIVLSVIHTSCTSESSHYCLVILDKVCKLSQVQSVIHTSCTSESSYYSLVILDIFWIKITQRISVLKMTRTEGRKDRARSRDPSGLKKGNLREPKNWRLINLLPICSKTLEMAMNYQFKSHLESWKLFSPSSRK